MGDRGIQGPKGMDGPMVSHSRLSFSVFHSDLERYIDLTEGSLEIALID